MKESLPMAVEREYRILYFASLRDLSGKKEELRRSSATTPRELYDELRHEYGFDIGEGLLRVAINEGFADWDRPLSGGETVVFIPPVSGG